VESGTGIFWERVGLVGIEESLILSGFFHIFPFRKDFPTGITEPKLTPKKVSQPPENKEISLHKGNRLHTGRVSIDIHK
jgi:hypothetical protein